MPSPSCIESLLKPCIWYVSKYVAPPAKVSAGGRGYLITREFARMGYGCVIITSDSNQLAEVPRLDQPFLHQEVDGIQLYWVRTMKYVVAKSLRRILSWLDFEWRLWRLPKEQLPAPDVVIVSSLSLLTILNGFLLRRRYKCRLVLEIRDIWPLTITEEGGFSRWNPLVLGLGFIEKLGYRYADAIVGTMPNLGEHVTKVSASNRPTYCVPMGVDVEAIEAPEPLPADYAAAYLPQGKFVVAYAGSIGISNALDVFFECIERMQEELDIHFIVLGDGDLRPAYEARYGPLPNLTFAPRIPKTLVHDFLSRCDLLYFSVHQSAVWDYGLSLNKLIDYMLAAKPVVASYSGYPSMINEAGCGTFVPAGDASGLESEIRRIAQLPAEERSAMGARGRAWLLEHRDYRTLAKDYLRILLPGAQTSPRKTKSHSS